MVEDYEEAAMDTLNARVERSIDAAASGRRSAIRTRPSHSQGR